MTITHTNRISIACALAATASLVAACTPEAANKSAPPSAPPPKEICDRTARSLADLKAKLPFEYGEDGASTMEQKDWLALTEASRKSLADALGYHAACSAREPKQEQEVVIRSEYGQVLTRRFVRTAP